jgi:phosphatidylserine/phosphatidylglycerophosphate/cardiolipin synthase-like enzyme
MARDAAHVPPAVSGPYPLRDGNRVRPLVDGEAAFRRIIAAVEGARHSVWVTVAFMERALALPDGRGSLFDLLARAADRGADIRVLFWRDPDLVAQLEGSHHFGGNADDLAFLRRQGSRLRARWDRVPRYCHHQKSWVVDAGRPTEVAFVGGINLEQASMVPAGHPPRPDGPSVHDVYCEIAGPAATDVHHNFVQRWNEASERDGADGCWPDRDQACDLPFPERPSPAAGDVPVQITRTVRAGLYGDDTPAPGGPRLTTAGGDKSILEQYLAAIDAARSTLYFENQFFGSLQIVERVEAALARGVDVVCVVPIVAMEEIRRTRAHPAAAAYYARQAALGAHPRFTLAGLSHSGGPGRYADVYVHAKMLLVDDAWATIGSANLIARSFHGDTELNASFWHGPTVKALRTGLLAEHLGVDTGKLDDRAALARFATVSRANQARRARGEALQGLAIALDPADYP